MILLVLTRTSCRALRRHLGKLYLNLTPYYSGDDLCDNIGAGNLAFGCGSHYSLLIFNVEASKYDYARLLSDELFCRAKEERRINLQALQNFL